MIGILLGLICGAIQFFLLRRLTRGVVDNRIPIWVIPANMGVLALFFVPCGLFVPHQLAHAGIAAAATLIGGALIQFLIASHKPQKENLS